MSTTLPSASPADATAAFPAFKEWAAVVAALGAGAQTLILRKGGIAEGRGGFDPTRAARFWLFPTAFHAQREKLKPAAAPFFPAEASAPSASSASSALAPTATLSAYADLIEHRFLTAWDAVAALDPHHLWTEAAVRERHAWSQPAGLHLLVVRVYRLHTPVGLPAGLDLGGCKSWIDLPLGDPAARPATTALSSAEFAHRQNQIRLALSGG